MRSTFIPREKANITIISSFASDEIIDSLESEGIKTIMTIGHDMLQSPVSNHPDMVMFPLDSKTIVVAPDVWGYYQSELCDMGINVIRGNTKLKRDYPFDIPYNAAMIGNAIIHRLDKTDSHIGDFAAKNNISMLNTKQGYSKCSLALVDNRSGITADRNIAAVLTSRGFDILLIEPGHILLPGLEYGFIGGATGHIAESEMVITGKLHNHPDEDRILEFIHRKGVSLRYLSNGPAMDLGTIIGLNGSI